MISMSVYLILVSLIVFLIGVFLLRIAIRGKQISPHPHCRKCRFDLFGLDLTDPTPCPECGTTLRKHTPAITDGLRKTRKLALLVSILFLLTSATGFAWPKLSKFPSIQSINIYDHFPEPLLTKLATTGDDQALQTLHDRLIPGEVSDNALHKLIDHAFALQADESVPWDERWGDVLLFAFDTEALDEEQVVQYIRDGLQYELIAHDQLGSHSSTLAYWIRFVESRGRSSYQFQSDLLGQHQSPWTLRVQHFETYSGSKKEANKRRYQGSGPSKWIPYTGFVSMGSKFELPAQPRNLSLHFPMRFTVQSEERQTIQWDTELHHRVNRLGSDPEYIKVVNDQQVIDELIEHMTISKFSIPMRAKEMSVHQSIRNTTFGLARLEFPLTDETIFMGHLSFRLNDVEIRFKEFILELNRNTSSEIFPGHEWKEPGWLKPFIENESFWDQVLQTGYVDVIYRPDPILAEMNPGYERMIGLPVIFRQVPIHKLLPVQVEGAVGSEWRYNRELDYRNRVDTPCEILEN